MSDAELQKPPAKRRWLLRFGRRRLRSLQKSNDRLRGGNQRIGIAFRNGLPALGLNRVDEGAQGFDRSDVVLYAGAVEGVERRIQLRVQAVFNPVLDVEADDFLN